jgi:hypothetical protein
VGVTYNGGVCETTKSPPPGCFVVLHLASAAPDVIRVLPFMEPVCKSSSPRRYKCLTLRLKLPLSCFYTRQASQLGGSAMPCLFGHGGYSI